MTEAETKKVLAVLRGAYPNFYRGMGKEELLGVVALWQEMFADDPAAMVAAAVKRLIASDTKGFPPVIGQVKEQLRRLAAPAALSENEAWGMVRRAVRNGTYGAAEEFKRLPAVIQGILRPEDLKAWAAMDEGTVDSVVQSNFMRSYRARRAEAEEWQKLPEELKRLPLSMGEALPSLPEGLPG